VKDIVEGISSTETQIGFEFRESVSKTGSPPGLLLESIVLARLQEKDCADKGWILEGWPSEPDNVHHLLDSNLIPLIGIILDIPDVVVEDRVSFRLQDPKTGQLYHMISNPPPLGVGSRCITRPGESTDEILQVLYLYRKRLPSVLSELRQLVPTFVQFNVNTDVEENELSAIGEEIARRIERGNM